MSKSTRLNKDPLQDRFALKTVSYLASGITEMPHDISERLRVARSQAVAARKVVKIQTVPQPVTQVDGATLTWGNRNNSWAWSHLASFFPLVLLVVGLLLINTIQTDNRAQEVAEVDLALLTDALPPAAFSDPGFVQFLKNSP
jgi:hypothetical protein